MPARRSCHSTRKPVALGFDHVDANAIGRYPLGELVFEGGERGVGDASRAMKERSADMAQAQEVKTMFPPPRTRR